MSAIDGPVRLVAVAPVFSSANVADWLDHYRARGFAVEAHDDEYGFAVMGAVQLHVSRNPDHDPRTTAGCAYLYVDDADVLWRKWSTVPRGKNTQPVDTDHGLREGAHIDPRRQPPPFRIRSSRERDAIRDQRLASLTTQASNSIP